MKKMFLILSFVLLGSFLFTTCTCNNSPKSDKVEEVDEMLEDEEEMEEEMDNDSIEMELDSLEQDSLDMDDDNDDEIEN